MKHIPTITQDWILTLFLQQRKVSAKRIYRGAIIRWVLWQDGVQDNAIPGYADCPPDCGRGYPAGWTLNNFRELARRANDGTHLRKVRASSLITAN